MPEPSREQLQKVYNQVVKTYGHRENVTGVDVGFRYDKGKRTNQMAVRIHVREKIPEHALEADEIFPKTIDDVPIDVIQAVYTPHPQSAGLEPEPAVIDRRRRFDTLQPGISIGHEAVTAGTLGAIVYERQTSRRGILSNWHVLAGSNKARPGDPIVQPGPKHGGRTPQDTIARLERFLLDKHGDAAFALLNASRQVDDTQLETDVRITKVRQVQIGDIVAKSGRTTGVTRGLVEGIGQYTLTYPTAGTHTIAGFKVVAEEDGNPQDLEISAGGDSGALWFAISDHHGVGLHFAGETDTSPGEEHALACHLDDVLTQLDVTLQPAGTVPAAPQEPQAATPAALARLNGESDVTRLLLESVVRLTRVLELTTGSVALAAKSEPEDGATPRHKPRQARLRGKKP
jgi:endonuclease G